MIRKPVFEYASDAIRAEYGSGDRFAEGAEGAIGLAVASEMVVPRPTQTNLCICGNHRAARSVRSTSHGGIIFLAVGI